MKNTETRNKNNHSKRPNSPSVLTETKTGAAGSKNQDSKLSNGDSKKSSQGKSRKEQHSFYDNLPISME